ncbi:hypothetical protein TPHA_0E00380 [Tetrapisispora phaffii CBS 4417]|uniref:Kinetochore-associated protein n=1 Tax=Tetrapisispora phaffii (strain ATCC 24235 / CBS 4417 / NBRC 1672 / NRRL Y-8282 / UCD 70-5) TaxID=1071381 RepID=G8BTA6_TETPH|nr:hypothetical protein TPHA_0E00380 [Tetrapisispora phaffii CBS 4417]CCE63134.1 hypothetical protein TPHA_0E00380 [Tetrapisispora phaffii CBS 4417]
MNEHNRIRYIRFNQVFEKAFSQSVSKLQSWDKLSSCFPEYSMEDEGASNLENCQKQVIQFWTELCKREFNEILKEKNVKEKLDSLDDLIAEAKVRVAAEKGNPTKSDANIILDELDAKQLLELNLHTQRVKTIKDLDIRLDRLNNINTSISDNILSLEKQIETEREELDQIYKKYLGDSINKEKDEVLVQGLHDMVLELQEL